MKIFSLLLFYFIAVLSVGLYANDKTAVSIKDTVYSSGKTSNKNGRDDSMDETHFSLDIRASTGIYINKTIGVHPILNIPVGITYKQNSFNLDFEQRFGDSKSAYQIIDNDTVKSSHIFNGECLGFAYERIVYDSDRQKLVFHSGIGYDWFTLPKGDVIHNSKTIGGLNFNIGLGYSFFFVTRHGPNVMLIYHYSDMKNEGGSKISPSSLVCRLTYNFGHEIYNQK